MATCFSFNGIALKISLGPCQATEEGSAYCNGIGTLPDGKMLQVGGGWVLSPAAAMELNHCHGLQPDMYPDIYWPGAVEAGDFDSYDGYDNGDMAGLAAAVGLSIDRTTEDGEANWVSLVTALQAASSAEWNRWEKHAR